MSDYWGNKKCEAFWKKVDRCAHDFTDYYNGFSCATPLCEGGETHCRVCKAFIIECGCGFNNGYSGWSTNRHKISLARQNAVSRA